MEFVGKVANLPSGGIQTAPCSTPDEAADALCRLLFEALLEGQLRDIDDELQLDIVGDNDIWHSASNVVPLKGRMMDADDVWQWWFGYLAPATMSTSMILSQMRELLDEMERRAKHGVA